MTYNEWLKEHTAKKKAILDKLQGKIYKEVIEYFDYDNMKLNEPEFCPLYDLNSKCHNIDNLNCFFCACPHFNYSDDIPVYIDRDKNIKHYSKCGINSKYAKEFIFKKDNETRCNCDCSECTLPHTKGFIEKFLKNKLYEEPIKDSCSLLELVRAEQLRNTLGKYKIF